MRTKFHYRKSVLLLASAAFLSLATTCFDPETRPFFLTNDTGQVVDTLFIPTTIKDDPLPGHDDFREYYSMSVGDIDPFWWCWSCSIVDGHTRETSLKLRSGEERLFIARLADSKEIIHYQILTGREIKALDWHVRLVDQRVR